jgi:hypothetical protein
MFVWFGDFEMHLLNVLSSEPGAGLLISKIGYLDFLDLNSCALGPLQW